MDLLEINSLQVRTEIGFSPHELGKLQELVITIHLQTSTKAAGDTDCVQDAINLKTVTKEVIFHVENKKYNLIEAVATDVARICVVRHGVPWARVNVKKPNALRFSDYSAFTIERCLEDFEWRDIHISLGSNISPFQNIPKALDLLNEKTRIVKCSRAFRTTPVGFKDQEDFVNMAVVLSTNLSPEGLKLFFTDVERQLGRIRDSSNKSGPRVIDLDITFWGKSVLEYKIKRDSKTQTYSIPDPDALKYAHVIIPLADVTSDFIHPINHKPLLKIAEEVTGVKEVLSFFPAVELKETEKSAGISYLKMNGFASQNGHSLDEDTSSGKLVKAEQPVALITGAAKRLGAAIAKHLHSSGYNIIIHHNTSKTQATALCQELNSLRVNSAWLVQADLSSEVQNTAENIISQSLDIWGRLDVLVNNASQFYPTTVGAINEKDWNNLIQTNLGAPLFLSQAAFSSLKASRGSIINILDVHGHRPLASHSIYCISKAGLHMCTLALAKEFAPHVRVNGVAPGAILWPNNWEGLSVEALKLKQSEILKNIPMERKGIPSDIASAVEFFASSISAGYVTGHVIDVDGGRTLNQ